MNNEEYSYKVTASIITYNQVDYIKKAIDSAIVQQVDFAYEIVIGDDCSTDGTRQILLDYKQKYPDLIKLNLHDKHYEGIAGRLNNITNIRTAQGEYIAFLDGDDYWLSEDKLQKQADFMDSHPEYSFCFHDALIRNKKTGKEYYLSDKFFALRKDATFSFEDIMSKKTTVASSSTFFRKELLEPFPDLFWKIYSADRLLQLLASERGGPAKYFKKLKYLRLITENSFSSNYEIKKNFAKVRENDISIIKKIFKEKAGPIISFGVEYNLRKAASYYNQKNFLKSIKSVYKAVKKDRRITNWIFWKLISRVRFYLK